MNKKQQGDIGVAQAIADYTRSGAIVCVPLTDNSKYDLLIDRGKGLVRVQVKTSGYAPNGKSIITLRTKGGNQSWGGTVGLVTKDNVDELYTYDMNTNTAYVFPPEVFDGKATITLGSKYDYYKVDWPTVV